MSPTITPLRPDILLFEHLLEPSLCTHLIAIAKHHPSELAGVELSQPLPEARNNHMIVLEGESLLASTHNLLLGKVQIIQRWLLETYGLDFGHAEACSLLRYEPGQFYKRHIDNILKSSRAEEAALGVPIRDVSVVGYLNEGFEGGETYFDRQDLRVKPQTGAVLVFPSNYVYPHQSLPVTSGTKYAWTTWLYH